MHLEGGPAAVRRLSRLPGVAGWLFGVGLLPLSPRQLLTRQLGIEWSSGRSPKERPFLCRKVAAATSEDCQRATSKNLSILELFAKAHVESFCKRACVVNRDRAAVAADWPRIMNTGSMRIEP